MAPSESPIPRGFQSLFASGAETSASRYAQAPFCPAVELGFALFLKSLHPASGCQVFAAAQALANLRGSFLHNGRIALDRLKALAKTFHLQCHLVGRSDVDDQDLIPRGLDLSRHPAGDKLILITLDDLALPLWAVLELGRTVEE